MGNSAGPRRLRALQTSFLVGEEVIPGYVGHTATVMAFEGPPPGVSDLTAALEVMPHYRLRIAEVPGGVARPTWVEDGEFDVRNHVRAVTAAPPGGDGELRAAVASVLAEPIPRAHPLWELVIVDGLAKDRWALVSKVQEAMTDGGSVVPDVNTLFAGQPARPGHRTARASAPVVLAGEAVLDGLRASAGAVRRAGAAILRPRPALERVRQAAAGLSELAEVAKRPVLDSPFNGQSSSRRAVEWVTFDHADLQRVARGHAVTVNDVYVTILSGALRRWLTDHGIDVAEAPFRAMVPVAVHDPDHDEDTYLGMLTVALAIDEPDAERRLARTAETMRAAMSSNQGAALGAVLKLQDAIPAGVLRAAGPKLWTAQGMNVTVTSTPGRLAELAVAGRRMVAAWEVGFLTPGLKATFASLVYGDRFAVTCIADPDAVDDLDALARACVAEARALGVGRSVSGTAPDPAWSAGPAVPAAAQVVPELVERQVERTPDAPAIEFEGRQVTYAELNARANRLAHRLRGLGVGPDVVVATCLRRSPDLVVALLAILKAGGAYLPLDPDYPADRLRLMVEGAETDMLLTEEGLEDRVPRETTSVLVDEGEGEPDTNPDPVGSPEHLAYVMYTSGSTGTPKAVAMPHAALTNLLTWQVGAFARPGPARTLQFASVSFDVAFQDIFSTLSSGGCVVMVPDDVRRDFDALASFVETSGVQRLFIPPLVLNELAHRLDPAHGELEIIAAGERLEITPAVRRLFAAASGWTLDNHYGPTESHAATAHRLEGDAAAWPQHPPIGKPIANLKVYLLDADLEPVPQGEYGELYVAGAGLARGYWRRPELTAERFVDDPSGPPGSRMYRTGDLARWRRDGAIEFLGRTDDQVKIRGVLVEPSEVEARLAAHPDLREAAVRAVDGDLVAYVVAATSRAPSTRELREFVARTLPSHMVPASFVPLPSLPLSPNGKLDRQALPAPRAAAGEAGGEPRNETEATLAAIWAETLGVDRIGIDDDFFGLGGHSVLAANVVARAREELGREIPLRLLYEGPTIAKMAQGIEGAANGRRLSRTR